MTGRERLLAAFRGAPVDRAPIWLREGFPFVEGPAAADHFTSGWQADPAYRELYDYAKPHAEAFFNWGMHGFNRALMAPPDIFSQQTLEETPEWSRTRTVAHTPGGNLESICETRRGVATGWILKHLVESREDLEKLAAVPFAVCPKQVASSVRNYRDALAAAGDRYVLQTAVSSPIVVISGCMPFEMFLEFSLTERARFHELLTEITRRTLAILEAVFEAAQPDTTLWMGGAEQCTPPMMAPQAFDEYVVPYDGEIIRFARRRGVMVQMHCHGKIRHALRCMCDMGVAATDPVEPPPAGDVSYAEAREIVGDRLTLMGNLEFDRLEFAEPADIRRQVRQILALGNRRLVLGASAGPISAVTPRLAANYRAWIDAALEFGGGQ